MWKRIELISGKEYVLNLCQSGSRFCRVAEKASSENDEALVFRTEVIPIELLEKYEWDTISENYRTVCGRKFYFGAHGEWLVDIEYQAFVEDKEIPWVNEQPEFAPK